MEKQSKERLFQYLANGIIAIAVAIAVAVYELNTYGYSGENWSRFLCDGFFVSAVLYIGFGLLAAISRAGNFYAFSYLLSSVKTTFCSSKEQFAKRKTFYDYVEEKKAKDLEKPSKFHWRMLIIGVACLAVSMIFLMVFRNYR